MKDHSDQCGAPANVLRLKAPFKIGRFLYISSQAGLRNHSCPPCPGNLVPAFRSQESPSVKFPLNMESADVDGRGGLLILGAGER